MQDDNRRIDSDDSEKAEVPAFSTEDLNTLSEALQVVPAVVHKLSTIQLGDITISITPSEKPGVFNGRILSLDNPTDRFRATYDKVAADNKPESEFQTILFLEISSDGIRVKVGKVKEG